MNKKTIILIFVVIALLAGAGVWKWKKKTQNITEPHEQNQEEISNNEKQESQVDTSNWKTYHDEKYKFEIKYNPNWEIKEARGPAIGGDFLEVIVDKSRMDIGMGINRFKVKTNPEDWFNEFGFGIMQNKFEISGYLSYYSKRDDARVDLSHQYAIYYKQKLISFDFQEKYRKTNPKTGEIIETSFSQYLPNFEAMVNSIKFFD